MLVSKKSLRKLSKDIQIYGVFLLFVSLCSCTKVWHLSDYQYRPYSLTEEKVIARDSTTLAMIAPYKEKLDREMYQVIGELESELMKKQPESTLGNWVSDMIHVQTERYIGQEVDFAVVNYGGLRVPSLPAGELTVSQIFELMPFDNQLVILKVDGKVVQQFFQRMAERGGWPISYSVRYEINEGTPVNIRIKDKAIEQDQIYKIAISDFVANGGDRCFFFRDQEREATNVLFRDAMLEFIQIASKDGQKLGAKVEGRVVVLAGNQ